MGCLFIARWIHGGLQCVHNLHARVASRRVVGYVRRWLEIQFLVYKCCVALPAHDSGSETPEWSRDSNQELNCTDLGYTCLVALQSHSVRTAADQLWDPTKPWAVSIATTVQLASVVTDRSTSLLTVACHSWKQEDPQLTEQTFREYYDYAIPDQLFVVAVWRWLLWQVLLFWWSDRIESSCPGFQK